MGLFFVAAVFGAPGVKAGWLIDHGKFHVSVHGQNSCGDCHEDIYDRAKHPDPSDVNRPLSDFFKKSHCLACHDDISAELDKGLHGPQKILEPKKRYDACIECHNPHEQLPPQARLDGYDPQVPPEKQCAVCHEQQSDLPPFATDDRDCMICHLQPEAQDTRAAEKINGFCLGCHDPARIASGTATWIPFINPIDDQKQPHAQMACTQCHLQAAAFKHKSQRLEDCRQCHRLHDEKVAHDAHLTVACGACHLQGVLPVRDRESKRIVWKRIERRAEPSKVHEMVRFDDESSCRRCHHRDNAIGAAALVLPAKSVICMPCHAATLSIGDTTTILTVILFLGGMAMTLSLIFSGAWRKKRNAPHIPMRSRAAAGPGQLTVVIKTIAKDVLFQNRLLRQSRTRWLIHSLIFFPMVVRFLWGLVALSVLMTRPGEIWIWDMLDKNNALTGFLFDLTGLMILIGVILAMLRGRIQGTGPVSGLPRQDRFALILIGAIVLVGFVLEGLRIAMTAAPGSAEFAFVGFGISRLFSRPAELSNIYGYGWYLHAILTGIFIVYIPFSRLLHVILSPLVLAWNAVSEQK